MLAALLCLTLQFSLPDTMPPAKETEADIEAKKAFKRLGYLAEIMDYGSSFNFSVYHTEDKKDNVISVDWNVDSTSFADYETVEKIALAFDGLMNFYVIDQKYINLFSEYLLLIKKETDTSQFHSFNFIINPKLKYRRLTVDEKMHYLKLLSYSPLEHASVSDPNNPLKFILRLNILAPLVLNDPDFDKLRDAFKYTIESFVLAGEQRSYSRYELIFTSETGNRVPFVFPLSEPVRDSKNENL